jgi:hypothetical protein
MQIWIFATAFSVALPALGVWAMRRLYDTPTRTHGQSGMCGRNIAPAPQNQAHSVRLWVDDGGNCIDGEVRHA